MTCTDIEKLAQKHNDPVAMTAIEKAIIGGDLKELTPFQRVYYYNRLCDSIGLNPLTRPFDYLMLNGKIVLYANKTCSEQLRKINKISVSKIDYKVDGDMYTVTISVMDKEGRLDCSTGVVCLGTAKGDMRANLMMKAETKAKRRATLSISGLGWLDEIETETIKGAKYVQVDDEGEILDVTVTKCETSQQKPESKPEEQPKDQEDPKEGLKTISNEQAKILKDLSKKCSMEYQTKIIDTLKKNGCGSWKELPIVLYDDIKKEMEQEAKKVEEHFADE